MLMLPAMYSLAPLLLVLLLSTPHTEVALAAPPIIARPNCMDTCGNVSIPFPFGIGPNCFLDSWFEIECKASLYANGSSRPFLSKFGVEVKMLSVNMKRDVIVGIPPMNVCISDEQSHQISSLDLRGSPYDFSTTENYFLMKGCPGTAVLISQSEKFMTGCSTYCHNNKTTDISNNMCYGAECCQNPMAFDRYFYPLQYYHVDFYPQSSTQHRGNCIDVTLIESGSLEEYTGNLSISNSSIVPVNLHWNWISSTWPGDNNPNAHCYNETETNSTSCYCQKNYYGNPYVYNGCEGIFCNY